VIKVGLALALAVQDVEHYFVGCHAPDVRKLKSKNPATTIRKSPETMMMPEAHEIAADERFGTTFFRSRSIFGRKMRRATPIAMFGTVAPIAMTDSGAIPRTQFLAIETPSPGSCMSNGQYITAWRRLASFSADSAHGPVATGGRVLCFLRRYRSAMGERIERLVASAAEPGVFGGRDLRVLWNGVTHIEDPENPDDKDWAASEPDLKAP
jgi:hypothetical protein